MTTSGPEHLDPRFAELLSAAIDGAATPDEQAQVEALVQRSPVARAEREGLLAVKAALGGLPPVDPPAGFYEAMLARGTPRADATVTPLRRRPTLAAAAAVAAAAACVVVAGTGPAEVTPPVDEVEAALTSSVDDVELRDVGGARFALRGQDGEVAWEELPNGDRADSSGASTWVDLTSDPGVARVVVAREGRVYTLVSDELDSEALVAVGLELPGDESIVSRFRRACQSLLGSFSGG